jgi:hypothetical protein
MSIVRIGSNDKYANGWSLAFGRKKSGKSAAAKKASPKKKTAKKAKRK